MSTITPLTPCRGRGALYDVVLHPDSSTPSDVREAACWEAAALCARCPAPCFQPVRAPRVRLRGRRRLPELDGTARRRGLAEV
ncbi:hypothetical protein ACTWP5_27395 [Streptomyces sp. 4N509B]|uniref:hypothetical protein n=1 Tax=Streptomyces sp. 4N509B TaxID=3457413 RepID=UPI003FD534B7